MCSSSRVLGVVMDFTVVEESASSLLQLLDVLGASQSGVIRSSPTDEMPERVPSRSTLEQLDTFLCALGVISRLRWMFDLLLTQAYRCS